LATPPTASTASHRRIAMMNASRLVVSF